MYIDRSKWVRRKSQPVEKIRSALRQCMRWHFNALMLNLEVNRSMSSRRPRWAPILVVVALAAVAIVAVPSIREPILRAAGWALVVNQPIAPSDVIVVSIDSSGAGALEAADLVNRGIATRVAVFTDPPSGEDYEFIRRGLPYENASARQIRQLRELGVTNVVQIPRTDGGTEGESEVLPVWCATRSKSDPLYS
jgi:hypothetical protein